jgi:hypothetical protein
VDGDSAIVPMLYDAKLSQTMNYVKKGIYVIGFFFQCRIKQE